jgi:hypothetical protein
METNKNPTHQVLSYDYESEDWLLLASGSLPFCNTVGQNVVALTNEISTLNFPLFSSKESALQFLKDNENSELEYDYTPLTVVNAFTGEGENCSIVITNGDWAYPGEEDEDCHFASQDDLTVEGETEANYFYFRDCGHSGGWQCITINKDGSILNLGFYKM